MPGDTVIIKLHYTELISPEEGTYQFVFPTVVGPRYSDPDEQTDKDANGWVETPYMESGSTITDCKSERHSDNCEREHHRGCGITIIS